MIAIVYYMPTVELYVNYNSMNDSKRYLLRDTCQMGSSAA
jgi:hypothetical protein